MAFVLDKKINFNPPDKVSTAIRRLEDKRKVLKEHKKNPLIVYGVGFLILNIVWLAVVKIFPLLLELVNKQNSFWAVIFFFMLFILLAIAFSVGAKYILRPHKKTKEYQQIYTEQITKPLLKSIDESFTYERKANLKDKHPELSDIMPSDDFEDLVCANINGVDFSLAEYEDSFDSDSEKIKFICFVADFNKKLHSSTVLCSVGYTIFCKNHKRIKLDNDDFNKNFITYSTNDVESRYILTSIFMEKILELNKQIVGVFYFRDNKLLFYGNYVKRYKMLNAFSRYSFDMFDINPDISLYEHTKSTYENLMKILSFVNVLNLDSKVWK